MDVAEQRLIDANAYEYPGDLIHMPTVDARPVVHGQWVCDTFFDEPVMRCTACKRGFSLGHRAERFPYCPNCGAKMDVKEEDK